MKELVILDLDGTLIKGQSQRLLLDYLLEKRFIGRIAYYKLVWWFILYKTGLVNDPQRAMRYGYGFLKGKSVVNFEEVVEQFFEERLRCLIYGEAVNIIEEHRLQGRELVLISNAIIFIPDVVSKFLGIANVIGTVPVVETGKFTGEISSFAYGAKKTILIKEYAEKKGLSLKGSWAYADHISDLPLLDMVERPFAVNPDFRLCKEAEKRGWKVLLWGN